MKIKTIGILAAAALFTGSLSVVQAEEAKKPVAKPAKREAAKESDRPSRESIIKRFDKDGDGKLSEEERRAAGAARRKLGERQSDQASDSDRREAGIRRRLEAADKEIREAVKAGKITEEQGKERMAALRKRVNQSQSRGNSDRSRLSREELTKRFDKNKDGKLDDEERASLRQSLSDRFRGSTRDSDSSRRGGTDYRARLMKEYDKNGDGKLDEKEREAARKAVSSRRGQGRGGSERGERSRAGERREARTVRTPSAAVAASAWKNTGEEKHKSASSSKRGKSQRRMLRSGSLRCARRSAATAPPSAVQEVRAARMPSAGVAAASVVKVGKTAIAATAAEGSKPTSPENDSTEAPVSRCLFSFTRRLVK